MALAARLCEYDPVLENYRLRSKRMDIPDPHFGQQPVKTERTSCEHCPKSEEPVSFVSSINQPILAD